MPPGWPATAPSLDRDSAHRYRLLSTRFDLIVGDAAVAASILPALVHLERTDDGRGDVLVEVTPDGSGYAVRLNGVRAGGVLAVEAVAPEVKLQLRLAAIARHPYFMQLHAGAVLGATGCWLLLGAQGSGKTTLTAGLVGAGLQYLSDEVALLEPKTLSVRPAPIALTLKPGAVAHLADAYPGLKALPVHDREDGQRVRYLPPPPGSMAPDQEAGYRVVGLLFPHFDPSAEVEVRRLDRIEAFRRLLDSCLSMPSYLCPENVEQLVRWMRRLVVYEVRMGGLAEAVKTVSALMRSRE